MKKNVWELQPNEVAIIDGKRYKYKRDFRKYMIGIGNGLNRELVNIEDFKDKKLFYRGMEVEVENE